MTRTIEYSSRFLAVYKPLPMVGADLIVRWKRPDYLGEISNTPKSPPMIPLMMPHDEVGIEGESHSMFLRRTA